MRIIIASVPPTPSRTIVTHEVLDADDLVVGGEPEVAADALVLAGEERLVLVGLVAAQQPAPGAVEGADPDHEPDRPADQVIGVTWLEVYGRRSAGSGGRPTRPEVAADEAARALPCRR